ncbi:MAG: 16S rRNA (guanine(966)-N(2))-methyltransferase RsmD [Bacillota bacterium]|nr:16S rRNA (guanine(966)-N(2))-methyltransferase RsmD [Candidatus Fermentithermobacillaceae bacterium]
MLRITGGYLAGRTISSLPGEDTRPPLTRVREAVANILSSYIEEAVVLDLFAGTGSFSFELLSRGARSAVLIDKNPKAVQVLRKNAAKLGVEHLVQVVRADALQVIERFKKIGDRFDVIIVAPPYFTGLDQEAMAGLASGTLLNPGGIVVLQQAKQERFSDKYGVLALKRTYRYGDTRISTYIKD